MGERRETPRVPGNEECTLSLNGRNVRARIEDLSDIGARFRLLSTDPKEITDDDLGADVNFIVRRAVPPRACRGELIRRYFERGIQHVAVRLWKKCRELQGP